MIGNATFPVAEIYGQAKSQGGKTGLATGALSSRFWAAQGRTLRADATDEGSIAFADSDRASDHRDSNTAMNRVGGNRRGLEGRREVKRLQPAGR
jgi:hypothetical protein